jgi:hypothetical protein
LVWSPATSLNVPLLASVLTALWKNGMLVV